MMLHSMLSWFPRCIYDDFLPRDHNEQAWSIYNRAKYEYVSRQNGKGPGFDQQEPGS